MTPAGELKSVENPVAWVFADPARIVDLSPGAVDLLLQQTQNCALGGRLAAILRERNLLAGLPSRARHVLAMAEVHSGNHARQALWEAACIREILAEVGQTAVLLKGAAYLARGLRAGRGRMMSDIDILVPRENLGVIESVFYRNGWIGMKADEYDDHYYREWSHELPPMQHVQRQTVVDIHHTILPPTARYNVDGAPLIRHAQAVEGLPGLMTLQPVDMVLHNIVHLFADGAMENGLRDLVDLQALLREFSDQQGFWRQLLSRAEELELRRPLYYALYAIERLLEYPVPVEVKAEIDAEAPFAMEVIGPTLLRALRPYHQAADGLGVRAARFAIFVRSHYLRMPMRMLIPHLTRKAFRRWKEGEAPA